MGHALMAWCLKYRVHFIAVGTLGFNPYARKFEAVKDFQSNEIAGFVEYSPIWPVKDKWGEISISAAGPAATALFALFLFILDITIEHNVGHGLKYLAGIASLDAFFNLLPFKTSEHNNSDGRQILKSLRGSIWTPDMWCTTRIRMAHYYKQNPASDKEWLQFREHVLTYCIKFPEVSNNFLVLAWLQTDPEAFAQIIEQLHTDISEVESYKREQYIACRILLNRFDDSLNELFAHDKENKDFLHYFAKSLLSHANGDHHAAIDAIKSARQTYQTPNLDTPAKEEDIIFLAIENHTDLPSLKWPALGKRRVKHKA